MSNKTLSVQIPAHAMMVLETLCQKTNRTKDDVILEAVTFIIEEYKEVIFDTEKKNIMNNKVPRKDISLESYKGKRLVKEITELELMQINSAREVIIQDSSHYSQTLKNGCYLYDKNSKWQIFEVETTDLNINRVVLWNERDDGSFSVHFSKENIKPKFYCFEN